MKEDQLSMIVKAVFVVLYFTCLPALLPDYLDFGFLLVLSGFDLWLPHGPVRLEPCLCT